MHFSLPQGTECYSACKCSESQQQAAKQGFTICYTHGSPFYDKGIIKTMICERASRMH